MLILYFDHIINGGVLLNTAYLTAALILTDNFFTKSIA